MTSNSERWEQALYAARLLASQPHGCGIMVKSGAGPVRDTWLRYLTQISGETTIARLPPTITDEQLLGGLDLTATLTAGRPVMTRGLLAETGNRLLILPMAERCPEGLAARLGLAMDRGEMFRLVALDEGEGEETVPPSLRDRLTITIDLGGLSYRDAVLQDNPTLRGSGSAIIRDQDLKSLAELASRFGIGSLRPLRHAHMTATCSAAMNGRAVAEEFDLRMAVGLALVPHARYIPQPEQAPPPPEPSQTEDAGQDPSDEAASGIPAELLLEAAMASLPPDVLQRLSGQTLTALRQAKSMGAGNEDGKSGRGRPVGHVQGMPGGGRPIDLVATLRTAAPWQKIRRRTSRTSNARLIVLPEDFRLKRLRHRSERALIFAVDASGSAAYARLAETKGAIELLLAEAYVHRHQVALIAFRGETAETLLPPTRSLVQAKRRLAALPGGGATPLASGLVASSDLAAQLRRQGLQTHIAVMTDGRGNVALDGETDRTKASDDAEKAARSMRGDGISSIVIDTGARPQDAARTLADNMGAIYMAMPRADAARLSRAVGGALMD